MNGPEHYREAERLLADAGSNWADGDQVTHDAQVASAQVHATLALAAATLQAGSLRNFENTVDAWAPLVAARRPRPVQKPSPR